MKKVVIVAIGLLVGALAIAGLVEASSGPDGQQGLPSTSSPSSTSGTSTPGPKAGSPSPTSSPSASASPTDRPGGGPSGVELAHLTDGYVSKAGTFFSASTDPVFLDDGRVTIVHLFSCCDHAAPPAVTAGGTTFDLVVTHSTGEKRHWVFRAVGADAEVPISFTFAFPQNVAQWVVDEAAGVPTTANGADAIGATAWQDSMRNASEGSISLAARSGAVVGFGLIGSGGARGVAPEPGYRETAEVGPGSYRIFTFWSPAPDSSLAATFVDESGTPQVMSWLFLAAELLPG